MTFTDSVLTQTKLHKSLNPQDLVKLAYQAAFGAEHLITDKSQAKEYLFKEYNALNEYKSAATTPLYEEISSQICRINLSAWKEKNLPLDWLFEMFSQSFKASDNANEIFFAYINEIKKLAEKNTFHFSIDDFECNYNEYIKDGVRAVHHSEEYRACEKPAYRIVYRDYISILPILMLISDMQNSGEENCTIAIDGHCGSGKTTMAKLLANILKVDIVHMDDFFLPINKRTPKRLEEIGGNIDYERFSEEVLPNLNQNIDFSYRIFDCSKMDFNGRKNISGSKIKLVEGAYSHHPIFKDYADIKIFSDISKEEQIKRIINRNGEEIAKMFRLKWIPLEEKYFNEYQIKNYSDIKIKY